ncbi:amelotin [Hemicordylus capensis]|uniref:amelotin n=1 Tax=Hemicordylus capensis TaxID=884348 RepID=UPI0023036C0F|nr:amelotin [Hemicordylus capensis]
MKIVILLLSFLGLTFCLPVNQFGRTLATSNSREILRLLQKYKAMGNTPKQTQQRPQPGVGLPPAKLVPDQNTLMNLLPNEVTPFEWPFANFPVIFPQIPSELGVPNLQTISAFNLAQMLSLAQMLPIDMKYMLPIIFAQMGPQGAVLSSEEMGPLSQLFAGLLLPGMQGGLLPSGQSEGLPDGQEGLIPAGQAGSNQGNLPFPEGTAAVTVPASIQRAFPTANDGLSEAASGPYPTPSGFRMPDSVTNDVFVEPTAIVNMEPSELREPPTSIARLDKDNAQKHHNLSRSLVRGDSHMPTNTVATKPLKEP